MVFFTGNLMTYTSEPKVRRIFPEHSNAIDDSEQSDPNDTSNKTPQVMKHGKKTSKSSVGKTVIKNPKHASKDNDSKLSVSLKADNGRGDSVGGQKKPQKSVNGQNKGSRAAKSPSSKTSQKQGT